MRIKTSCAVIHETAPQTHTLLSKTTT